MSERFRQDRLQAEKERRLRDAQSRAKKQANGTSEEEEAPPYKSKMGVGTLFIMLTLAAALDVLQLGVAAIGTATFFGIAVSFVFNNVVLVAAATLFFLWYTILGIEFLGKQQVVLKAMTVLGEFLSMGALPGWVVMILLTYLMERDKEKGGDGSVMGTLNRTAAKFGVSSGAAGMASKLIEKHAKGAKSGRPQ
jgi:hypothetical protein